MADRTNLLTNPSAETNTTGWSVLGGTLSRTSEVTANAGTSVLKCVPSSGGQAWARTINMLVPLANNGANYTASVYVRTVSGTATVTLVLYRGNPTWGYGSVQTSVSVGTTWTRISVTGTNSFSEYTNAYLEVQGPTDVSFYVDSAMIEASSTVRTYFDGDTTDTSTETYAWTGTAHASTSTLTLVKQGTATGGYAFTGSAAGSAAHRGTATGTFDFTGTTVGAHVSQGVATGTADFSGVAAGSAPHLGTVAGGFDFTGTAVGKSPNGGVASGSFDYTGSSVGYVQYQGSTSGGFDLAGSSVGAAPAWKPKNLVATPVSGTQIDLTWDALDYSTAYDIERDGVIVAYDVATNSYSDTGLTPETLYTYRVRAVQA